VVQELTDCDEWASFIDGSFEDEEVNERASDCATDDSSSDLGKRACFLKAKRESPALTGRISFMGVFALRIVEPRPIQKLHFRSFYFRVDQPFPDPCDFVEIEVGNPILYQH
jgi:hypothetical protein